MGVKDPHCFSHLLDDATTQRLIARLESRAKDAVFTNLFDQHIAKLCFPDAGRRYLDIWGQTRLDCAI